MSQAEDREHPSTTRRHQREAEPVEVVHHEPAGYVGRDEYHARKRALHDLMRNRPARPEVK
jgi:hypothetical protein